ncbi:MAG: hypothetical protein K7J15_06170, partial [Candidatus Regiella insecticola]|nr:hypothetical protein [Candidatus Regiella insecticola]
LLLSSLFSHELPTNFTWCVISNIFMLSLSLSLSLSLFIFYCYIVAVTFLVSQKLFQKQSKEEVALVSFS